MHSIERDGVLVYYIQLLCDEIYFIELLDRISVTLHEAPKEPIIIDGILEYDIMFDQTAIVIQYDPSLGVSMYLNSMDTATAEELQNLHDFADLIAPIV